MTSYSILSGDQGDLSGQGKSGLRQAGTLGIIILNLLYMKYLVLLFAVITIAWTSWLSVPYFGYPLGGYSQADISNMYPNAITPAGFTFSIWSMIYLSWLILGVSILLKKTKISNKQALYFSLAIALTGIWLVPWGYNMIGLSLIIMLVLL